MDSPPAFCTVTKSHKGNILAPYNCHKLVTNTKPETLTKTKYLQDSSDHHPESYNPHKTSFLPIPTDIATSLLDSPNQSTVLCNADKTSAATLYQLAKEEVFHPNSTSLAISPGRAQLSLPTSLHFDL